jgi:hypothetical protein
MLHFKLPAFALGPERAVFKVLLSGIQTIEIYAEPQAQKKDSYLLFLLLQATLTAY